MTSSEIPRVPTVSAADLEISALELDTPQGVAKAAAIYREHGAVVVRGLVAPYVDAVRADIEAAARTAIEQLPHADQISVGWVTPAGALFLPAPEGFAPAGEDGTRDKQIMLLPVTYRSSAAFFRSAFDARTVALVSTILGPDVEIFDEGQCLYKEPVGGHPKNLHQDSSYFEHRFEGPMGALCYAVDTDLENGALHLVPGSQHLGTLDHIDTFSHLGLDETEWPWTRALPICGNAGDAIFFHYRTIHGSKENHSQASRPVFIHRYRQVDDYVTVGAATAAGRTEAEKNADKAHKSSQRGLMLCGTRR